MIIECVANVSEGRDARALVAMADAIRAVPGVSLADATKIVMIGSVLDESIKADVGVYADAIDDFVSAYQGGRPVPYGADLIGMAV